MRGFWLALALVGCGEVKSQHDAAGIDSPTGTDAPSSDAPTDAPNLAQHLYVPNDATGGGGIIRFRLPLVAGESPDFTIPSTDQLFDVAFDHAGTLVAYSQGGKLYAFVPPFSATSTPFATFLNGSGASGGQIALVPNGTLIVSMQQNHLNEFTPPFTNATVSSGSISSTSLTSTIGVALDAQANLYVANNVAGGGNLVVFPPPYTTFSVATPAVTGTAYRNVAVGATQLFVGSVGSAVRVDVYNLPLTSTSAPAFSITTGTNVPEAVDVAPDGRLYVGNLGNQTVAQYTPPLSASSAPDVTLTMPGTVSIFGIAVGP